MLITCSSCGKRISDRAPACPFCQAANTAGAVSRLPQQAQAEVSAQAPPAAPEKPQQAQAPSQLAPAAARSAVSPSTQTLSPPAPSVPAAAPGPARAVTEVAASARFERGDFIADGLQVLEVLGEGGFGIVYLVASHQTGKTMALKALRSELLRDARVLDMFRKEARIWIELGQHPHLVKAEWVNEIGGRLYLAMEYVRGRPGQPNSLEGVLKAGPPPLEQTLLWAIEFCRGMEHALARGIRCHRDIKPANVLIGDDGRVRISDFGIAGLARQPEALGGHAPAATGGGDPSQTVAGSVFGTPTHMSPEQFEDAGSCDERSDIYSFGVVLYQLTTGRLPFYPSPPAAGVDPAMHYWFAFRQMHRAASPVSFDSPLAAIVARCLGKARGERYASFAALRADIEALYQQRIGRAAPTLAAAAESVEALVNRGMSLTSLERLDEALACYDRALALAPNEKVIHSNKGNVLRLLGRTGEALACFQRALAIDPTFDNAWYNQGLLLTQAGRLAEALHCYEQALTYNVRHTSAWIGKGHVLGRLGREAEELQCLDRALAINPREPIAWFNKGNHLSQRDPAQALACYDHALEADPRYAQAWSAKALALGESGRHAEALACFDEALSIEAANPQTHYNKGNVLVALGRMADAQVCFSAATRLPGCLPIAWYNCALAEHETQRFDQALASLGEFVARAAPGDPFLPGAHALIQKLKSGNHTPLRTTQSRERIESAIETVAITDSPQAAQASARPLPAPASIGGATAAPQPSQSSAAVVTVSAPPVARAPARPRPTGTCESWNTRAAEHFREQRFAEALAAADTALALDPKNVTAVNNRANCLYSLGRADEALQGIERVLLLSPNHLSAWFNMGVMQSRTGRTAEALRTMIEIIELGQGGQATQIIDQARAARADFERQGVRAAARNHLGWLATGFLAVIAKQYDKALTLFDQALALRSDVPELWEWKGSALREMNRLDDSLACFDAALARHARVADLHHGRAMTLVKLRRLDDAVAAFDRALALDAEHAASWSDRGKTLGVLGRPAEALESFGHAAALAPENPAPWQNQALIADQLGRFDEALAHYREFLKWAQPDMRLQIEHAKARVEVLVARLGPHTAAGPSRVVRTPGHLNAVLATLVPLAQASAAERAKVDGMQKAGRHEEALVFLAGAAAANRYLASPGDQADLDALSQAMLAERAAQAQAAGSPSPAPTAVDALRKDPALRGLIPFADVSSAEMQEIAALMDAGRDAEAFERLAAAEARGAAARGGPTPEEDAASQAALDALMAIVDQRVAEQMTREARQQAGPAPSPAPAAKPLRPGSPVARKYAERAGEELKAGRLAEALASLDAAIARDNTVALFHCERGRALTALGRHSEARAGYEQALTLDPDCAPALKFLTRSQMNAGRLREALELASRAVGVAMGDAEVWANLASILLLLQSWHKASEASLVALRLNPKAASSWFGLGLALQHQGQSAAALEALNQGLALDPKSKEGWYQKGNALVDLGRLEEAVAAYQTCVGLDPKRANAWYNLGFALNELGRHAEAIAPCEKAIALYPAFDRAWVSIGVAQSALKRPAEALAAYDQALKISPDYDIAQRNKGDVLRQLGRRDEALACYDAVLSRRAKDPPCLRGRAELLDELQKSDEAAAAYEAYLAVAKIDPAESRKIRERIRNLKPQMVAAVASEAAREPIPEATVPKVQLTQAPPDCQRNGEMALNQGQPARALEWFDQSIVG
ncbi:MAG: tetratricopeptide repeat protein, partial [Vicinamibacteria bacterium]|nr:tetratricopeptide repeat protein [Vicinamibacteria bacterium]